MKGLSAIQTTQTTNPLMNADLLAEMLDAHLTEREALSASRRTKRNKPYAYPSMIGDCMRKQVYKMCGYTEPVSSKLARIFDNGNKMHDRFQTYFTDMGFLAPEDMEVPFISHEHRVSGRMDGILRAPDGDWSAILELKSANKRDYTKMQNTGPLPKHVVQVMLYMALTPIKDSLILVECKDNQDVSIFPVAYVEAEGEKTLRRVQTLVECADARRLPPREYEATSRECYWCYFKNLCTRNAI